MDQSTPFQTFSYTTLWLKLLLTAATLCLLYLRYRAGKTGAPARTYSPRTKLALGLAVVFSFCVFHNLGTFRGGSFVHYGEMFHYYVGSKYFKELGYYDLYNAVIVADTEQGNDFAPLPFYTDLKTYKNLKRDAALRDTERVKSLFSEQRWSAFKADIAFFKSKIDKPNSPDMIFLLMDHGYNASPVSTFLLGTLTNLVPLDFVLPLALIDVALVLLMIAFVFRSFGFELGALFAVYFFSSILSGQEFLSGSLLRYDWLLFIVVAVCLLDRGRYAWAAFFLTLSAMLRIFPAVLFYGIAVSMFQKLRATRKIDKQSARFIATAAATALVLFLLPAISLGSVTQPWKDFYGKISLHESGVYVNHLGFAGVALFEPSQLSLERFATAYQGRDPDIVRHWQDVKEHELRNKRPLMVFAAMAVLACITVLIWRRQDSESSSVLWPLFLIYATSYVSAYYYTFLCLFILLFFRRANSLSSFLPVSLLLILNLCALITDSFKPSPIVFFTLLNLYLFVCFAAILGFELFNPRVASATVSQRERRPRARRK
ncbi:MAG TPA: hypothetical protein VFN67_40095 [Polyangiales bacterium]|nr:hypothetical protein [Polyangiales bacterium]